MMLPTVIAQAYPRRKGSGLPRGNGRVPLCSRTTSAFPGIVEPRRIGPSWDAGAVSCGLPGSDGPGEECLPSSPGEAGVEVRTANRWKRSRRKSPLFISAPRSLEVAARTLTSTFTEPSPPNRRISPSSMAVRSLACWCTGSSPTSSRKRVPPAACSRIPFRPSLAPVNAPLRWPKNSLSKSESGMPAQLIAK